MLTNILLAVIFTFSAVVLAQLLAEAREHEADVRRSYYRPAHATTQDTDTVVIGASL